MGNGVLCGVVVSYHPEEDVVGNLTQLRMQVDQLVVVDNGSSVEEVAMLRGVRGQVGFTLIENGENLGIASALNVGVRWAQAHGAEWVMLFDQDSRVTDGFVAAMRRGFETSRWGERLGILVPRYVDSRLGTALPGNTIASGGLEAAMTSASMLRTETFARYGYFVDELFIDAVDYEFSLRLRRAGYVIDECPEAILLHAPGAPRVVRLGGRRLFQTANYSAVRRYYQERNKIWVARRYFADFPVFCAKLFWFSSKDFVKILVAETGSVEKCRYFLRGMRDGARERMGRL